MKKTALLAILFATALGGSAFGQSVRAELPASGSKDANLVVLQRDKKAGIGAILLGALFLTMWKAPEGRGAEGGGSGFGEGDLAPIYLGVGLIVLGLDQTPKLPSWTPSISYFHRKPTLQWTISRW